MKSENPIPPDPNSPDAHDERLGALINEYFDRRERGEVLSKEEFLALHPEVADELRDHLSGLDLIAKIGSSGAVTLPGDETIEAKGSSAEFTASSAHQFPAIEGYEIHRMIGRGGMGVVYKATQISTKRQVALKVLLEGPLASDQSRKRFEREIEVAAQLRHSNIIPIYDSGKSDGRLYYAMAYIRGQSLTDYLAGKRPSLDQKLRIFIKICQAVRHAHVRGVMHRDLKPTNVLVDADGEPHILDFGLAKASTLIDVNMSVSAQIVGTPAYMSPEQAAGDPSAIDTRTDIYSLGVVLYEALTGKMPYATNVSMGKILENIANAEPPSPSTIDRKINGELSAIVMKALEKNKDRRYQSLDIFQSDVEKFLAGEPISVKPVTAIYLLNKTLWKYRKAMAGVAALLVIAVTTTSIIRHYSRELKQHSQELKQQMRDNEAKRESLALQKQQLEQERLDFERERNKARAQLEYVKSLGGIPQEVAAAVELTSDVFAGRTDKAGKEIVKGLSDLVPESRDRPPSKFAEIEQNLGMSPPPLSSLESQPIASTEVSKGKTPDFLDYIGRFAGQALNPQIPNPAPARPTTMPATTQPAEPPTPAGPTSQPVSHLLYHADAGNTSTTQAAPADEKDVPPRENVISEG